MILTDRALFGATLHNDDLLHLVDVSNISENPAGSSFKLKVSQLKAFVENNIYSNDGALAGARVVTQNGFALNFVGGNVGIGITPSDTDTRLHIQGVDSTFSNFALKVKNSASQNIISVRNDRAIIVDTLALLVQGTNVGSDFAQFIKPNGQALLVLRSAVNDRIDFFSAGILSTMYFQGSWGIGTGVGAINARMNIIGGTNAAGDGGLLVENALRNKNILKTDNSGYVVMRAENAALADGFLTANECTLYLDEALNNLIFKVKYSTGVVKTVSLILV